MEAVILHFPEADTEMLPLSVGTYHVGCRDGLLKQVLGQADALVTLNVDRCGIWMTLASADVCVHVNGRRVYRVALLRSGDVIHVDSAKLRLCSAPRTFPLPVNASSSILEADPRVVLRALGGPDHGRCFTLERLRFVGRGANADIQVDAPNYAERHAHLAWDQGRLLLRHFHPSGRSLVNGEWVQEAALMAGDQLVFSPHHRFVLETPQMPAPATEEVTVARHVPDLPPPRRTLRSFVWLLIASGLLAAALTALLFLGPVVAPR